VQVHVVFKRLLNVSYIESGCHMAGMFVQLKVAVQEVLKQRCCQVSTRQRLTTHGFAATEKESQCIAVQPAVYTCSDKQHFCGAYQLQKHHEDGAVANPPPPGKVLAQEACHHRAPWALLQVQTTGLGQRRSKVLVNQVVVKGRVEGGHSAHHLAHSKPRA
jgi:hypothetical protein